MTLRNINHLILSSPSYFRLPVRWLSSLTPVTYLSTLQVIHCVAAFMQLELFRAYGRNIERFTQNKRTHN
ncbi:hypothetical protein CRH15_19505 [Lelliottia amnigena]|nr:hypothetical protein CO697_08880 [Lelliottia amnigena]PEG63126.1 hypothetical protein CRH15_19505 [Lelliottia amnigena]